MSQASDERTAPGTRGDPRLQDPQALDEIELYGEVLIAASQSDGPLSTDEIDAALGLRSARRG